MRDKATKEYLDGLTKEDWDIIRLFNMNCVDIPLKLNLPAWKVSDVTGRYIGFLQAEHSRGKVKKESSKILMGKKEPYYQDEMEYGSEHYRLEFARWAYGG